MSRRPFRFPTDELPFLDLASPGRSGPPGTIRFSPAQVEQINRTVRRTPLCVAPHNGVYVEYVLMWSDRRPAGPGAGIGLPVLHIIHNRRSHRVSSAPCQRTRPAAGTPSVSGKTWASACRLRSRSARA